MPCLELDDKSEILFIESHLPDGNMGNYCEQGRQGSISVTTMKLV